MRRNIPDGKIKWPEEFLAEGKALLSVLPTWGEKKRGWVVPLIYAKDGRLFAINNILGVAIMVDFNVLSELYASWFSESAVYESLTYLSKRRTDYIILGALDKTADQSRYNKALKYGRDAMELFRDPPGATYVQFFAGDTFSNEGKDFARATGWLVSSRQLKPVLFFKPENFFVAVDHMCIEGKGVQMHIKYRDDRKKAPPSKIWQDTIQMLTEAKRSAQIL